MHYLLLFFFILVQLAQPQTAKDIENFYVESVVDNNIPRGAFTDDASSLFPNRYTPSNSKQQQQNQKLLSNNHPNHFIKTGLDDVEWLSPGRRKADNINLDKNLNKLEHQLAKLQNKHSGNLQHEGTQEEQKKLFLQPSDSGSLEDYNVIQTKVQAAAESLHKVEEDDDNSSNNNENNDDNDDDCDNNNNKSGDNKRVNVWKQVELFQAGNALSKNWSLTVQELVLDTEFEQQDGGAEESDDVMSEQQQQIRDGEDNVVTVYFR